MRKPATLANLVALGSIFAISGCGGVAKQFIDEPEILRTNTVVVNGHEIFGVAGRQKGVITHLGVFIPYALIENPPAVWPDVALEFPDIVKRETFFNHIQVRWEPSGHPPAALQVPMFDIRAFGISEAEADAIAGPDSRVPDGNRIPPEYVYSGVNATVPDLGVRAMKPEDLRVPFIKAMALSYWHNELVALEPMITQKRLNRTEMEIFVPQPEKLGRAVRYPTHFRAVYSAGDNPYGFEEVGYGFVFEDFVNFRE